MVRLLIILLLFSGIAQAQPMKTIASQKKKAAGPTTYPDSAMFNFSASSATFTGVTNVTGNPHTSIRTGTGAYGIGVSSIATGRWSPFSSNTSSNNGGESGTSPYWEIPTGSLAHYWYTQPTPDCSSPYTPNLEVNGLVAGATYTILIAASRDDAAVGTAQRYMSVACTDASGSTRQDDYNVKGNLGASYLTFNVTADGDGKVFFLIQSRCPTDGSHSFGYISFLKVKRTPR